MISNVSQPFASRFAAEAERLRTGGRPAAAPAASGDAVQLSAQPGSLPAALQSGPPVDGALVERIGAAIAGGSYPVDADRIASAMFRDFIEFSR